MTDCPAQAFGGCADNCDRPCVARTIPVINLDMQAARSERNDLVVLAIWVPILILGLLVLVATIYPQAARQWHATIIANQEP